MMIDGATSSCITGSSLVPKKKKKEPCQQHPVRLESQDTRWKPGYLGMDIECASKKKKNSGSRSSTGHRDWVWYQIRV
jgi:hypothetical protein